MKKTFFVLIALAIVAALLFCGCGNKKSDPAETEDAVTITTVVAEQPDKGSDEISRTVATLKREYCNSAWDGSSRHINDEVWKVLKNGLLVVEDQFGLMTAYGYPAAAENATISKAVVVSDNGLAAFGGTLDDISSETLTIWKGGNVAKEVDISPLPSGYQFDDRVQLFSDDDIVVIWEGELALIIDASEGQLLKVLTNVSDVVKNSDRIRIATYEGNNFSVDAEGELEKLLSHWRMFPATADGHKGHVLYAGDGISELEYLLYANTNGKTYTLVCRNGDDETVVAKDVVEATATIGACYYITSNGTAFRHSGGKIAQVFTGVEVIGLTPTYSEEDAVCAITTAEYANMESQHCWQYLYNPA